MKSEVAVEKFEEALRNLSGVEIDVEEMKSQFKTPKELDRLLANGPVVCSIFNHNAFKLEYISRNVEQMLGRSAERLTELEYQRFLKKYFHPEDLEIVIQQLFADTVRFINKNAKNNALRISIHYNYRMQTVDGNWIKVEQQTTPIKLDGDGNILLDQSFYSPAGKADFDEDHSIVLSIYLRENDGLYKNVFSKTYLSAGAAGHSITQRELEVLELLAKGKTSKEIGKELFISQSTVVTHRKNMLQKFDLKNTSELIAYAFKFGMLY